MRLAAREGGRCVTRCGKTRATDFPTELQSSCVGLGCNTSRCAGCRGGPRAARCAGARFVPAQQPAPTATHLHRADDLPLKATPPAWSHATFYALYTFARVARSSSSRPRPTRRHLRRSKYAQRWQADRRCCPPGPGHGRVAYHPLMRPAPKEWLPLDLGDPIRRQSCPIRRQERRRVEPRPGNWVRRPWLGPTRAAAYRA